MGFIDPRWFRENYGGTQEATLTETGCTIAGKELVYDNPDHPAPGTVVIVTMGNWITYRIKAEVEAHRAEQAAQEAVRKEAHRQKSIARRLEAEAQHQELTALLPFQFTAGIKDVLSGLSEKSWGDGRNRATVQHILLLDDYQAGRLKRRAYDFLCTSASGSNGKNWTDNKRESWVDLEGVEYVAPITCKACLKIVDTFKKQQHD